MTSNAARAATLIRALQASIEGDTSVIGEVYTDDVTAWAPALSAASAADLAAEFERRDTAFSDIDLDVAPLDVGGDHACAEWTVRMTHSGKFGLAGGVFIEPTGLRITDQRGHRRRVPRRSDLLIQAVLGRVRSAGAARSAVQSGTLTSG